MSAGNYLPRLIIIGGGIAGAFEAYCAYLQAVRVDSAREIILYEKNASMSDTTVCHIAPSLTPDEILTVIPLGAELLATLNLSFEQGGLRVDDIPGVNDSSATQDFIEKIRTGTNTGAAYWQRNEALFQLGMESMRLWNNLYATAHPELKTILQEANYHPCEESDENTLHKGYRIDLMFGVSDPIAIANEIKTIYARHEFKHCRLLSPAEVLELDPQLDEFCALHTIMDAAGNLVWDKNSAAIFRPGGCIDTTLFLPKFYAYLERRCAEQGINFQIITDAKVTAVNFTDDNQIAGLQVRTGDNDSQITLSPAYTQYVFCPGSATGTLRKLGFHEPESVGIAGTSLKFKIPLASLPPSLQKKYATLNNYMSVYQHWIHVAWQARCENDFVLIGLAGTKAFYGDVEPHTGDTFMKAENLLQLNIVNNIFPELIGSALNKVTTNTELVYNDLEVLENKQYIERWIGIRAVAYDGCPTLGVLFKEGKPISNARTTTHLGSGGVSFAPAAVQASRSQTERYFTIQNYCRADR
jgi:hypothetical protein